ncbi:hypothetical protein B0H14DRAFT_3432737 [Mycena olivaceomarginata]|nr:hypothetical protein B0H14DRAFT_3432737 [Mycena olivaceomarginata]
MLVHSFAALVIFCLPLVALDPLRHGGGHTDIGPDALHEAWTIYTLKDHYTGEDFLKWNFFTAADPTHGTVNYLSLAEAQTMNLAWRLSPLSMHLSLSASAPATHPPCYGPDSNKSLPALQQALGPGRTAHRQSLYHTSELLPPRQDAG